jgi:hypothetical protein
MKHIILASIQGSDSKIKKCFISITEDEHNILAQSQDTKAVDLIVREKLDQNGYSDFKFIVSDIISANISI